MARLGRAFLPDQPLHLIQRGNNRQPIFLTERDRALYGDWLAEAANATACAIHAYVLMGNHVHLLLTPTTRDGVPRLMQSLGRRYVGYVNAAHARTGTLWEGRYRAAPIDSEAYLLICSRYIELNPVRAGLARHPRDWRWSSYRANAEGAADPLVSPHELYSRLGSAPAARRAAYRELFRDALGEAALLAIRQATNGGWALGDAPFRRRIAAALGRRVDPLPRGRKPRQQIDSDPN